MSGRELSNNIMLVHLSLASRGLRRVDELNFPNLHVLDLNDNQLWEVHLSEFRRLSRLERLSVSGNPLASQSGLVRTEACGRTELSQPARPGPQRQPAEGSTSVRVQTSVPLGEVVCVGQPAGDSVFCTRRSHRGDDVGFTRAGSVQR